MENLKNVATGRLFKALERSGLTVSQRGHKSGIVLTMAPLAKKIGKLGIISYGGSEKEAQELFNKAKEVLGSVE